MLHEQYLSKYKFVSTEFLHGHPDERLVEQRFQERLARSVASASQQRFGTLSRTVNAGECPNICERFSWQRALASGLAHAKPHRDGYADDGPRQ